MRFIVAVKMLIVSVLSFISQVFDFYYICSIKHKYDEKIHYTAE